MSSEKSIRSTSNLSSSSGSNGGQVAAATFESFGSRTNSIKNNPKSTNSSKANSPTGNEFSSFSVTGVSEIASQFSRISTGSGSVATSVHKSKSRSPNTFLSTVEEAMLRSDSPIEINEPTESITVIGNYGVWLNREEVQNWKGQIPIEQYEINEDKSPEVITKKSRQQIEYVQELAIRYLRPPTPPAPGEIVITQLANFITGPAPPLIIRQQPARPETPEPLVIREAPPTAPIPVGIKKITISGKQLPPPPRKVIIERMAAIPAKPQAILIERWLPYSQVKRRVIFNKPSKQDAVIVKPRNIIVQWEAPQVQIKKEYKYLGVIAADPNEYVQAYGSTLKQSSELPEFVREIPAPDGLVLAADFKQSGLLELEGDVHALKLIDLDAEGLGEYRDYVRGIASGSSTKRSKSSANVSRTSSISASHYTSVSTQKVPVNNNNSRTNSITTTAVLPSFVGSRTSSIASTAVKSVPAASVVSSSAFKVATTPTASIVSNTSTIQPIRDSIGSLGLSTTTKASSNNIHNLVQSASSSRAPSASGSFHVTATLPIGSRTTSIAKSQASLATSVPVVASVRSPTSSTVGSLASSKQTQRKSSISSLVEQIFHTINRNHSGGITIEDAEKALLRLNSRLGRRYGEDDVVAFFSALDKNQDGTLDFEEFKSAFENIVI